MNTRILLISIFFILNTIQSYAQGCSDAGVCTMGAPHLYTGDSVKVSQEKTSAINYKITQSVGLGEQNTMHLLTVAELNWKVSTAIYLQLKVPYLVNIGNIATTHGIGDLSFSSTIIKNINSHSSINTFVGFKIPVNNANIKNNSKPLPMPYQTSLGTFDGVLGFVYQYKQWNFTTAYQKVLISDNENSFLASSSEWVNNADAAKYFGSYKFMRGDDAILKAERNINISDKWIATPSILAIYRVQNDRVQNPINGVESDLVNSNGLTLNIIGNSSHHLNNNKSIDFTIAFPLIVRKVRADGLTRSLIASAAFRF